MQPFTGKIYIENGKIHGTEDSGDSVVIFSDGKEYNFENACCFPGFVDAHGHVAGLGMHLSGINLNICRSAEECAEKLQKSPQIRGEWIIARGWNQEKWVNSDFPGRRLLDIYFPRIPVCLTRVDGHAAWVNSKALEIAGIGHTSPDPPGGMIIRDRSGIPTGILLDNAMQLIIKHIPEYTIAQIRSMVITAMNDLVSCGFTEVHDMDVPPEYIPIFSELQQKNKMPIRIQSYISAQNNEWEKASVMPEDGEYFNIKGLKFFADGALGSKGAALIEGYRGEPENKGLLFLGENEFLEKSALGLQNGFQIATHAIGDASCRMVLNVYEKLREDFPDRILRI